MSDVATRVKETIAYHVGRPVQEEDLLEYLTSDEIDKHLLVIEVEEEFDLYIEQEVSELFETVQDVIDYVEGKV
jgi:acyl carrier protein